MPAQDEAAAAKLVASQALNVAQEAKQIATQAETKSISTETTFDYDVRDQRKLLEILKEQAAEIAEKLARENCSASTIGVKLKGADFRVTGRQTHLAEPTRDVRMIYRASALCLRRAHAGGTPVRLLGLRVASLVDGPDKQLSFFTKS